MKIKVKDLQPNPYREIGKYPIDRNKIESLKRSIQDTTFWDNILVRKHPEEEGKYQISYGHHRLETLKELGIKEVDLPVKNIQDYQMVKIMAEENLEWLTSPKIVYQTILSVKKYLDDELAKHNTWEDFRSDKSIIPIESEPEFRSVKGKGIGRLTISKFLGSNFKEWMIQSALSSSKSIQDGILNKEAVNIIPTLDQADVFRTSVKRYGLPKNKQMPVAKKIVKEKISSNRIPIVVRKAIPATVKLDEETKQFLQVKTLIEDIDVKSRNLYNKIRLLRKNMRKLDIQEINGAKAWLAKSSLSILIKEIFRLEGKNYEADS